MTVSASLAALCVGALLLLAAPAHAKGGVATSAGTAPMTVAYRTATVDGLEIFYREAGPADAPVVLLLHGFPASSFMFRGLIEQLSAKYRVIAPDYPGFGYSAAPSTETFAYTFERLADVVGKLTEQLGMEHYAIYMQDFGGPVGLRLAARHPERVTALIVQNANAYEEGLPDSFWKGARALWADPSPANFATMRDAAMSDASLKWQYTQGMKDPARVSPDNWLLQSALLSRPGSKDAMLALLYDYRTNLPLYPEWQKYLRKHQPPMLVVWGKNDFVFQAAGARAYTRDVPRAELHLLDSGHFALEDKGHEIARLMKSFLRRNGVA